MLELNHIHKLYNPGTVNEICLFDDFNLKIDDGQFVSVVGSNGSGKTSMLNIICGSIPIDGGSIVVNGTDITKQKDFIRHRRIGRVFQDPSKGTCPSMTILENMALADNKNKPFGLGKCVNKKRIDYYKSLLEQCDMGLENRLGVQVGTLSGGQRQRLCIARALLGNPKIVIFDDSSSALDFATDSKLRKAIHDELSDTTVIIVSQRVNTVKSCDRIIVMNEGGISAIGTHSELYKTNEVYNEICLSQLSEREVNAQ